MAQPKSSSKDWLEWFNKLILQYYYYATDNPLIGFTPPLLKDAPSEEKEGEIHIPLEF